MKKLRDGDVNWLPEARGNAVKIIATLLPYLPDGYDYRIVFMRRAMPEILASQRTMLIRQGEDPDKVSDEQLQFVQPPHTAGAGLAYFPKECLSVGCGL